MTEDLEIRSRPKPVRRLNRKMVIAAVSLVGGLLVTASFYALEPRDKGVDERQEMYNITHKQTPEGLNRLPKSYQDIQRPSAPELGEPYMGDTGPALHAAEKAAGVDLSSVPVEDGYSFRPSAMEEDRRAARLHHARQQALARESGVFFQISGTRAKPDETRAENRPSAGEASFEARDWLAPGMTGAMGPDWEPTTQDRKKAFLEEASDPSGPGTHISGQHISGQHIMTEPPSPYRLMSGTVIAASLMTGINSDLPGQALAQVTENVYDTVTGNYLLIPQGTRLIGRYDSEISAGQQRVLVVWERIIRPDGSSLMMAPLPGADKAGYAGLSDDVDWHGDRLLKGVGLATLLGVGSELAYGGAEGRLAEAIRDSSQSSLNQAGQKIIDRHLDIPPTITVRPGWPVRILVGRDLILTPYGDTP